MTPEKLRERIRSVIDESTEGIVIAPEKLRERIRSVIDESTEGIVIAPELKHLITQICFEFYKVGWKECSSSHKIMAEQLQEQILK